MEQIKEEGGIEQNSQVHDAIAEFGGQMPAAEGAAAEDELTDAMCAEEPGLITGDPPPAEVADPANFAVIYLWYFMNKNNIITKSFPRFLGDSRFHIIVEIKILSSASI